MSPALLCQIKKTVFFLAFLFVFLNPLGNLNAQTCNSNNYAAGKSVTVNDVADYAQNITDGNLSTDWFTGQEGIKWAYIDLGQSYNLCKAMLKWNFFSNVPQFIVQGSNTANSDWVDLVNVAEAIPGAHAPDNSYDYSDVDLSATTTAYRYVRIYFPNAGAWGPHLREVEIYIKEVIPPAEVHITSPAEGSNFTQGANITINATATVQGGTISKVEFYQGDTKLGEDLSFPYQYVWNSVMAGEYVLVAKAWNSAGQSSVSDVVNISVAVPSSGWSLTGNVGTAANSFLGTTDNKPLIIKTNGIERLRITPDGKIGIGTGDNFPTDVEELMLSVKGSIRAKKLKITQSLWADYVFDKDYKLPNLQEVEEYIRQHHHLPGIPSTANVQTNGLDVGDSQALLLQKIEELTLYMIQLNKDVEKLKQENAQLKQQSKGKKK